MTTSHFTQADIRKFLIEAKNIPEQVYVNNLRTYNHKTFYYYLQLLATKPMSTALSARAFRTFIHQQLSAAGLSVSVGLNPDGWFSRSWTQKHTDPEYFHPIFETILDRNESCSPYTYMIRPLYYRTICELMPEIERAPVPRRTNLGSEAVSPSPARASVAASKKSPTVVKPETVRCVVTDQLRLNTLEEQVRQSFLKQLLRTYGYERSDLGVEFTIDSTSASRGRADIVIFYPNGGRNRSGLFAVIECKRPGLGKAAHESAQRQLQRYVHDNPNVRFAALVSDEVEVWQSVRRQGETVFVPVDQFPQRSSVLPAVINSYYTRTIDSPSPARSVRPKTPASQPKPRVRATTPPIKQSTTAAVTTTPITSHNPVNPSTYAAVNSTPSVDTLLATSTVNSTPSVDTPLATSSVIQATDIGGVLALLMAAMVVYGLVAYMMNAPSYTPVIGGMMISFLLIRLLQLVTGRGCAVVLLILLMGGALISPIFVNIADAIKISGEIQVPFMIGAGTYAIIELLLLKIKLI